MDEPRSEKTHPLQIKAAIQNALDLSSRCRTEETSENYEFLDEQMDQVADQAGKAIGLKLDLDSLLEKLGACQPLIRSAQM